MAFKCGSLIFSRDMMTNDQTGSIFETFAEAQRYFMGVGKLNDALTRLVNDLRNHEIDYVVITSGSFDILVEVVCEDDDHLLEILSRVRGVPSVTSTETFVYLKLRKQTYSWGTR